MPTRSYEHTQMLHDVCTLTDRQHCIGSAELRLKIVQVRTVNGLSHCDNCMFCTYNCSFFSNKRHIKARFLLCIVRASRQGNEFFTGYPLSQHTQKHIYIHILLLSLFINNCVCNLSDSVGTGSTNTN